jgi:hypothetical protein
MLEGTGNAGCLELGETGPRHQQQQSQPDVVTSRRVSPMSSPAAAWDAAAGVPKGWQQQLGGDATPAAWSAAGVALSDNGTAWVWPQQGHGGGCSFSNSSHHVRY